MTKPRRFFFCLPFLLLSVGGCRRAETEAYPTVRLFDILALENIVSSPFLSPEGGRTYRFRVPSNAFPLKNFESGGNPLRLKRRLGFAGKRMEAILAPPRSEYSFEVIIPKDAVLEFGLGVIRDQRSGREPAENEVRFMVRMEARGRRKTIFFRTISLPAEAKGGGLSFSMENCELGPAGFPVRLSFLTTGEPSALSFWFNPVIYRKKASPRNVILISLDALRPDHLGCYGYSRPTSPHMDALAKDGVLFERAYTAAPWTLPSHVSILSGLFGISHGIYMGHHRIPPSVVMLPEVLRKNGFFCHAVTGAGLVSPLYGFWRGFDTYHGAEGHMTKENSAELVFAAAADWLEKNTDKDAFLFLHTYQVHSPYASPSPYGTMFTQEHPRHLSFNFADIGRKRAAFMPLPEEERQNIVDLYDGEIRYTDEALIGSLVARLKKLGLYDRTMIILLSDHGEEFLEKGAWQHGQSLYESALRVPLIIKLFGSRHRGERIRGVSRLVDVMPTVLDELGVTSGPGDLDGMTLIPLVEGKEKDGRFFLADTAFPSLDFENPRVIPPQGKLEPDIIAFGAGAFKLILNRKMTEPDAFEYDPPRPARPDVELYDLLSDPGENVNLATERPEVVREMLGRIRELYGKPSRRTGGRVEIDDELRAQLRALGYIR